MATGSALGAKLEYAEFVDKDTPVTYAELLHLGDFEWPVGKVELLDTTVHSSAKKAYVPGIVDRGTVSIPIVWDDAETSHQWVEDHLHEKHQFRYTPKNGAEIVVLGIVKSLTAENPRGTGPKMRTLVLRLSGGDTAAEA